MTIFPSQGLGDGERNGDEIYVKGIMVRMIFQIPHDRRNTKFKLWYVPYNSVQGNLAVAADFMHVSANNTMLDFIQTDRWKGIKYIGQYRCSAADMITGSQDKIVMVKKWIPINRKVTFISDASQ